MKIITHDDALGTCEYIPGTKNSPPSLQPGIELMRGDPRALHFNMVSFHLKHLMGEMLTVLEATIDSDRKLNATKSIVKARFSRKLDWIYEICGLPEDGTDHFMPISESDE